jgi:hypothetical protein
MKTGSQEVKRFKREAWTAEKRSHPIIVATHDAHERGARLAKTRLSARQPLTQLGQGG